MTNEEYIRGHMPLADLADHFVQTREPDQWEPRCTYGTTDGKVFEEYDEAYKHELDWMGKEYEGSTIEQNKELVKLYPFLLPRNRFSGKVSDDYDYSYTELDAMPWGWRKAFGEQLCAELREALIRANFLYKYRIVQIKEKYGSLRWYDNGAPEEARKIINKYESLSGHTCIKCGAPATCLTTMWIEPYCSACAPKGEGATMPIDEH